MKHVIPNCLQKNSDEVVKFVTFYWINMENLQTVKFNAGTLRSRPSLDKVK